jgi:hypothetical protein
MALQPDHLLENVVGDFLRCQLTTYAVDFRS